MQVELDAGLVAHIQKKAAEKAEQELFKQIMAKFDINQLASEVKNLAAKKLADNLAERYAKNAQLQETVNRSVQSAEARINTQIAKLLEGGIKISLKMPD